MSIYFQRHSQTDWNKEHRLQGSTDIPLNEYGIIQSKEHAQKYKEVKFTKIICSNLSRAKQTATIINQYHNLEIEIDERIQERGYGDFEGTTGNKEQLYLNWDIDKNYSENNVEPLLEFFNRISRVVDELKERYKGEDVLVVTHSGVIIAVKQYINGVPKDKNFLNLRDDSFLLEI